MDWSSIFSVAIPIIGGGIRNVAGWLEASLKDGEIQSYEWTKLVGTILEVGVLTLSAIYGLGLDITQATGVGVLGSFLLSAIKKAGTK